MSGAEGIVDKDVGQRAEVFGKRRVIVGLFRTVTGVFQKDNVAVFHGFHSRFGVGADDVVIFGKRDRLTEELGKTFGNRRKRELRFRFAFRFAEMRAKNDFAAVGNQFLDGGKSRHKTVFIRNDAILQRNVEVAAAEDSLAGHVNVINGFFVECHTQSNSFPDS